MTVGERSWVRYLPLLFATALGLSAIGVGFFADDYALLAFLKRKVPHSPAFWDLYRFAPNDARLIEELRASGVFPWWTPTDFSLHLFRPIASLLLVLDHALFGRAPLGYHLHSALWYVALVAVVGKLHDRLLTRPSARLATIVYAISAAHAMPAGWVSARHLTVAAVFACLALHAHLRWREDGFRPGCVLSPLLSFAALLSSESGVGAVAYVVSYELVFARPRRLVAALPAIGVLVAYAVLHGLVGAGARNGDSYVDPLGDPLAFAGLAAYRFPLLLGNALTGVPAELSVLGMAAPLFAVAAVATALFALGSSSCWPRIQGPDRQNLGWLLGGAVFAIAAMLGGPPGARQLTLPNLALSALFAVLIRAGLAPAADGARPPLGPRVFAIGLVVVHVAIAPLAALANIFTLGKMAREVEEIAASADVSGPTDRPLYVIASDPMVFIYVQAIHFQGTPPGSCWCVLSAAKGTHRIRRTGASSIELEVAGTTFLRGPFETIYRSDRHRFVVGDTVTQCGARFRVLETRSAKPVRVAVEFDAPLDSPAMRIIAWESGGLRRLRLPSEGTTEIPWTAGPMGSL